MNLTVYIKYNKKGAISKIIITFELNNLLKMIKKLNIEQLDLNQLINSLKKTVDISSYVISLHQKNLSIEIYPRFNYTNNSQKFIEIDKNISEENILQSGIIELNTGECMLVDPLYFKEYQIYIVFSCKREIIKSKPVLNKTYLKIRDLLHFYLKYACNEQNLEEQEERDEYSNLEKLSDVSSAKIKDISAELKDMKLLQDRLITILESVSFGILIIDPKTFQIMEINSAASRYIGLPKKKIIGGACNDFVCPSEWGKCPYMNFKEKVLNSERVLVSAKGERIPILKTVKKVNLGGKDVIIESFIDIREQKKAQLEAEESVKLKTAFLSNISHELRTPLNHILGFTSLVLEDDKIEDTYKEYLGIVKRSGNNLLRIIEDIVTISKIEAGHHIINENEFDLKQSIYKVYTKYQSENIRSGKGLKLIFENKLGVEHFLVKADEMKIVQITENLINNAIKYTDKGSIVLRISADKSKVNISVSDTGKGIRKEHIENIFESFRQVETSDRKIYDGTGIGLTICRSLSNIIGGNLEVESEFGKGSTFTFSFPYKKPEKLKKIDIPDDIAAPDLTGHSIMVVEDEKINYLYIKTLLQPTHVHIIWKNNGKEALEYFEKKSTVDLILMDMQMPVMNGYIATEEIRKLNKKTPIIALTANVLADDRQKCLNLGCNEYTTKPIQQDVLFWHLQHFLS